MVSTVSTIASGFRLLRRLRSSCVELPVPSVPHLIALTDYLAINMDKPFFL